MRSLAGGVPRTANLKLKTDIKNNPQCSKKSLIVKLQQSYRIDHDDHGASKFNSNTTHSIPVSVGYLFDPVGYVWYDINDAGVWRSIRQLTLEWVDRPLQHPEFLLSIFYAIEDDLSRHDDSILSFRRFAQLLPIPVSTDLSTVVRTGKRGW